jgi:hypothetical protein
VDGIGDEFLARAVFTLDEDVRVARGHALDEREQLAHPFAAANDRRDTSRSVRGTGDRTRKVHEFEM